MERKISVSDITMKQTGEMTGNSLSFREKIELSKLLDKLGVSVIETAPVLNGRQDTILVKSLASAVKNSSLAVPVDIMNPDSPEETWAALQSAVRPRLQVSVPVSTVQMEYLCHRKPAAILQLVGEQVKRCSDLCPEVEFIAEDFSRSEKDFLLEIIKTAVGNGASIVTVRDVAGNLLPDEFHESVKLIRDALPDAVRLGVWCSNGMYMADSCGIVAVRAGADEIKTAPYGNATVSLKRFVHILNVKSDVCNASCDVNVTEIQRVVSQIKRLCEAKHNKFPVTVETSDEDRKDYLLSIHDSKDDVLRVVSKIGYDLGEEDADKVYETFVRLASKNETVEAKELDAIVASVAFQVPPTYTLDTFLITSGNTVTSTCHIVLMKGEERLESVCFGDGPVDAAFLAIEKVIGRHYELDDFQIQSLTEGRDSMGEAVVRLRSGGKLYSGRGISTDIIGSSVMAYISAVNKIAYEEDEA